MENADRPSYEELIARQGPSVYRLAFARLRRRADAEDAYQEVFLRYVEKGPVFEGPDHERAWFLRVTLNACNSLWRAPWRRLAAPLTEELPFEDPEELGLHQELRKLPAKYRTVLHLYYWEDLPTEAIAQLVGCKPEAARQRLTRARRMMKDLLAEEEWIDV